MSAAVAAILEGMPEPSDLRMHEAGGRCVITVGSAVLFDFDAADLAMRNLAIVTLRQLGFRGRRVAEVLGLTEAYVSTLYRAALRDGSAAVVSGQQRRGSPGTVTPAQWEQARAWRAAGVSDAEIGRRLGRTDNAARKLWLRAVRRLQQELGAPHEPRRQDSP